MTVSRRFADFSNQASRKNVIINGDFNIWQRGTSFPTVPSDTFTADRWDYGKSGGVVHTISRSSDIPSVLQADRLFNYSLLLTVTVSDTSIGAGDFIRIFQPIEGYNFLLLAQRPMVLSFWVKSNLSGTYCIGTSNNGADRSYVAEYTVTLPNTWEKKTIAIPASPSGGTWNYASGLGLRLIFTLAAGTTFRTTPNVWQTGNFFATPNQINHAATVGNTFRIAGVQLEAGNIATPLEGRTINEELALCQRYYEKSYALESAPGSNTDAGIVHWEGNENNATGSNNDAENSITVYFSTNKRAGSTVVFYDRVGNIGRFSYASTHNINQGAVVTRIGHKSFHWQHDSVFGDTVGQNDLSIHYTADAEL